MSKSSKRINNELKTLTTKSCCGAVVNVPDPNNIYKWEVILPGPKGSAYENGKFKLSFEFPDQYPFKHPEVKFITPMYHPNIKSDTGEICADVFANNWVPTQKVNDIIEKLSSLLMKPETDSPLEAEIAQLYIKDRKKWENNVKNFIKNHSN